MYFLLRNKLVNSVAEEKGDAWAGTDLGEKSVIVQCFVIYTYIGGLPRNPVLTLSCPLDFVLWRGWGGAVGSVGRALAKAIRLTGWKIYCVLYEPCNVCRMRQRMHVAAPTPDDAEDASFLGPSRTPTQKVQQGPKTNGKKQGPRSTRASHKNGQNNSPTLSTAVFDDGVL